MQLGSIADDLTGATDLAGTLVRDGLRVDLRIGIPDDEADPSDDATVIALKSRSIAAADAVAASLASVEWLRRSGAAGIFFKYASTFDSAPAGNIGPVTDALADALGATIVLACPAFPANGRTVTGGRLLVDGVPLAESPMRHHPLNPMTESSVVRLLAAQTPRRVGLVDLSTVRAGGTAIRERLSRLRSAGIRHAVADAVIEADLDRIAEAVVDDPLVTGGSALAGAIGRRLAHEGRPTAVSAGTGRRGRQASAPAVVLAGSASAATRMQIAAFSARHPARRFEGPEALRDDAGVASSLASWAIPRLADGPVLIAAKAPPDEPEAGSGAAIERTLGGVARRLVDAGVRRIVVAGGETSGGVVSALRLTRLDVGREIDPGVPVVRVASGSRAGLRLVLKSGNFGSTDFFERALEALDAPEED